MAQWRLSAVSGPGAAQTAELRAAFRSKCAAKQTLAARGKLSTRSGQATHWACRLCPGAVVETPLRAQRATQGPCPTIRTAPVRAPSGRGRTLPERELALWVPTPVPRRPAPPGRRVDCDRRTRPTSPRGCPRANRTASHHGLFAHSSRPKCGHTTMEPSRSNLAPTPSRHSRGTHTRSRSTAEQRNSLDSHTGPRHRTGPRRWPKSTTGNQQPRSMRKRQTASSFSFLAGCPDSPVGGTLGGGPGRVET